MASDSVGLFSVQSHRTLFNFCWLTNEKKTEVSSMMFSEDVKKVFDLAVTQHDPSFYFTAEWNCVWGSISSEDSFSAQCVYQGLSFWSGKPSVHVSLWCCFLRAPCPSRITGSLMRCFYTQRKWQHCGLPRREVYEWPHREAWGRVASNWRGAPIFTASENTKRRGENEDQVDWTKRRWRLWDDI